MYNQKNVLINSLVSLSGWNSGFTSLRWCCHVRVYLDHFHRKSLNYITFIIVNIFYKTKPVHDFSLNNKNKQEIDRINLDLIVISLKKNLRRRILYQIESKRQSNWTTVQNIEGIKNYIFFSVLSILLSIYFIQTVWTDYRLDVWLLIHLNWVTASV